MIRLLKMAFENPMILINVLPGLILLICSFFIAKYCVKRFQNRASNLMMAGVVIHAIQFVYVQLLNNLIIEQVGFENAEIYYNVNRLLYILAEGLFLYGIWKLVQGFSGSNEDKEVDQMGRLFLKK